MSEKTREELIDEALERVQAGLPIINILNALADYVPPPKWVPVSERLPDPYRDGAFVYTACGFGVGISTIGAVSMFPEKYTHWAPIVTPAPPAEKTTKSDNWESPSAKPPLKRKSLGQLSFEARACASSSSLTWESIHTAQRVAEQAGANAVRAELQRQRFGKKRTHPLRAQVRGLRDEKLIQ